QSRDARPPFLLRDARREHAGGAGRASPGPRTARAEGPPRRARKRLLLPDGRGARGVRREAAQRLRRGGATMPAMITITELAKKKVVEVADSTGRSGDGLRVAVRNGGTPRVTYALDFVPKEHTSLDEVVVDAGTFKIHIDPVSAPFLEGAVIDYVDGLTESGFKVEAPNAGPAKPEGPVAQAIEKVIAEKINPAVASHGG